MAYLPDGLPAPMASPDGLDTAYYEAVARHELVGARCKALQNRLLPYKMSEHFTCRFGIGWELFCYIGICS